MTRRRSAAASLTLLVSTMSVLAIATPSAVAVPRPATVQLHAKPIRIASDGSVTVVMFVRCASGLTAFEYGAGLSQGTAFGGASVGPTRDVLPCDGTRHRVAVQVAPSVDEFRRGKATLDANVSLFDPVEDGDLFITDTRTVRLR